MRFARRFMVLAAALALLGAACGGGGADDADVSVGDPEVGEATDSDRDDRGAPEPDEPEAQASALAALVAATPDRLRAESSARLAMTFEMTGIPEFPGGAASFGAEGAFDLATGNGSMTMDMSALGIPGFAGVIEMRIVDQVVYMDFSALADSLGGADLGPFAGVKWLKMDPVAMAEDLGLDPSELGLDTGATDLTSAFDMLREVASSVEEVGREDIRGVSTIHYRVEVDAQAALEQGMAQLPEDFAPDRDIMDGLTLGTIPIEVWIDDDGLLHRMVMDFSYDDILAGSEGESLPPGAGFSMTLDVFDFGVAVDVSPPPAEETVDMTELLGGFGDFGAGIPLDEAI